MSVLRIGILSTANIATEKVIPGMRRADRVEVVGHRVARRRAGAGGRGRPRHPERRMARTRRYWPIRTWTPCTSRSRTTSTPSGRSPRPAPGSTSCARSRWR